MKRHKGHKPPHERNAVEEEKPSVESKPPSGQLGFWPTVGLIAVLLPAMSWLGVGSWRFGAALAAFLILLLAGVQYLPGLGDKYAAEMAAHPVKPGRFDRLGVVWLLAIPFTPLAAWMIASMSTINLRTWRMVLGAEAILCVAVPVVCVLPMLRYVRGRAAGIMLVILFLGTGFPVWFGWGPTADLVRGPQWQAVEVRSVERVHWRYRGRDLLTRTLKVHLGDGRVVEANSEQVKVREGPCRILLLRGIGQIVGVDAGG